MPFDFDEQFLTRLVKALHDAQVEAIIVGNVASILHDAPVLTQDVDILVRDTKLTRQRLREVARLLGGTGPEPISGLTTTEHIVGADVPIDVLYDKIGGGIRFESLRARSSKMRMGKYFAIVASLEDVIKSKKAANRPKDIACLPILIDTLKVKKEIDK